jgi:hypothetical protein
MNWSVWGKSGRGQIRKRHCTSKSQASSRFALFEKSALRTCHRTGSSRYSYKHFVKKIRAHECFRYRSRHGSTFSNKIHTVRVGVWIRETGSGPPTHLRANSEPAASRTPPKALASRTRLGRARLVAPRTQASLAHRNPSRAEPYRTVSCRAEPSRARLVRIWTLKAIWIATCFKQNIINDDSTSLPDNNASLKLV